jgi:Activator of Hsp90 ATPase homolog 1-like protein
MFDKGQELAAIHRGVALDGESVSVWLDRTYDAEPADVWAALTNPERLPQWFYPVSGELRVGGTFQLEGNAGGEIRQCDAPDWLQITFGMPDSVIDLHLSESRGKTTLEFTHTVPLAMAGSGAGALFVGPGWDGALLGLGIYLRGETNGRDPLEAANSPEVIEFNRGSIDAWTEAIEGSGTATPEEIAGGREAAIAQFTVLPS